MRNLIAAALIAAAPAASALTWTPDQSHTEVRVYWNHSGFSEQSLDFFSVAGAMEFTPGDLSTVAADFTVMIDSLLTGDDRFDADLKSPNFFDVAVFPEARFVSTSVEQVGDMAVRVTGDLTIKDVTQEITWDVDVLALGEHPVGQFLELYQGEWLGIQAETTIKRSDFGIAAFIPVGSDEVRIVINSELKGE